jgi:hypothetical protein
MAERERIHNFRTNLIAFYRPVKKRFFLMTWDTTHRRWLNYKDSQAEYNFTLHRSTISRSGKLDIFVAKQKRNRGISNTLCIEVLSDGYFLQSGDVRVPILKKVGRALPNMYISREYTVSDAPSLDSTFVLWTVSNVSNGANVSKKNSPGIELKRIPQRIAWILAEHACHANEECPITTSAISPTTAAVTSCFHVFDKTALSEWFTRNPIKTKCPLCREICVMTSAFE